MTASTTALPDAYYEPVGPDEFDSTRATTSPWDEAMQHGGPPAALLVRAVERVRPDATMPIARISIDMLGPIAQGRIRTESRILRPGKRIELIEAKLWAGDRLSVTATAWRTRAVPNASDTQAHHVPAPDLPGEQEQHYLPGMDQDWGYGRSIEWRFAEGSYDRPGPASVWGRPRIPLVAGEDITPVQRLAVVADSANGLSAEMSPQDWAFIPPTMTLTLGRSPSSEWVNVTARTIISPDGRGVTDGDLYDLDGYVGAVSQPLVVAAR